MLQAENLGCERGNRWLFRELSFALQPGDLLQVEGPNGCGKTSLLRILCGLLPATTGRVWGIAREQQIYMGHHAGVRLALSVYENLQWMAILAQQSKPQNVTELLATVGLTDQKNILCKYLSAGQLRRLAWARLLLVPTSMLWILDEPFNAIDATSLGVFNHLIERHTQQGGMVVMVSHQASVLQPKQRVRLG